RRAGRWSRGYPRCSRIRRFLGGIGSIASSGESPSRLREGSGEGAGSVRLVSGPLRTGSPPAAPASGSGGLRFSSPSLYTHSAAGGGGLGACAGHGSGGGGEDVGEVEAERYEGHDAGERNQ